MPLKIGFPTLTSLAVGLALAIGGLAATPAASADDDRYRFEQRRGGDHFRGDHRREWRGDRRGDRKWRGHKGGKRKFYRKGYRDGRRDVIRDHRWRNRYANRGRAWRGHPHRWRGHPRAGFHGWYGRPFRHGHWRGRGRGDDLAYALLGFGVGALTVEALNDRPRRREPDVVYVPADPVRSVPAPARAAGYANPDFAGANCLQTREYQTVVVIGGLEREAYGTACLQQDGSWLRGPAQIPPAGY